MVRAARKWFDRDALRPPLMQRGEISAAGNPGGVHPRGQRGAPPNAGREREERAFRHLQDRVEDS